MLQKIIKINNVGNFRNYSSQGDTTFQKVTLIYGDNGRGKTTLASLFRSLSKNDPHLLLERRSTGSISPIEAHILSDKGILKFSEVTSWDSVLPEIEIFDSTFVNENIFSGNNVEHGHKKNLYNFVIGEEGVKIAEKMDQIDSEIKTVSSAITDKKIEIEEQVAWTGPIEGFINLETIEDVDGKIQEAKTQLDLLENADSLNKKLPLTNLPKFIFPKGFQIGLMKTLENISKDAEEITKDHINKCMDKKGEVWVQEGLRYLSDKENCPFCGQPLTSNDLLSAYKDYFSEGYTGYKKELVNLESLITETFSQKLLLGIQKGFEGNIAKHSDWSESITLPGTDFDFDHFTTQWNDLSEKVFNAIKAKQAQPLDIVLTEEQIEDLISEVDAFIAKIDSYNEWISTCNAQIDEFKQSIQLGSLKEARNNYAILEATKTRYRPDINSLCDEYLALIAQKESLTLEKKEKRDELKEYSKNILDCCVESINSYLLKFGAGFQLSKIKSSFVGGKPSTSYELIINDVEIPLGSADTIDTPSFKSVLSDGDKNSLAFAFFLSKLDHDKNISNKIVIFDDPITSFGLSRKTSTKQAIQKMTRKAKQVIVLSHDMHFLRMLWQGLRDPKNLQITKTVNQSTIQEWDIATATQSEYFKNFDDLVKYTEIGIGDPRLIVRSIRPLLEGNLRFRFPREFLANEWLGDFLKKIRNSEPGETINQLQKYLEELSDINDYSSKYHHQQNPNADAEPLHEDELKAFVDRTLQIVSS